MNEDGPSELAHLMKRTLAAVPARRAPASLEARVLRELGRRAALPWWRRSFARWPPAARALLVATCVVLIGVTVVGGGWTDATLGSWDASGFMASLPAHRASSLLSVAGELGSLPARLLTAQWLYVFLGAAAALYAALFGLGALAYHTLYLEPHRR